MTKEIRFKIVEHDKDLLLALHLIGICELEFDFTKKIILVYHYLFFWHILRKIISKFNILAVVVVHRVLLSNTHLIEIPILNKINLVVAVQNMRIMTTIKDQIQTEDNKNNYKGYILAFHLCVVLYYNQIF